MCTGYGCFAQWQVEQARQAQMAQAYNQARTRNSPLGAAQLRERAFQSNGYNYAVSLNKKYVRDQVDANVAAYNKAHDQGFWGGLVDSLSIVGHGLVNFGSGVVNFGANLVDLVADTAANAFIPGCALSGFGIGPSYCVDVPNIPSIPIYGDPDLYGASQLSGSITAALVLAVASGGIGEGGLGAPVSTALANASGWTLLKNGFNYLKTGFSALGEWLGFGTDAASAASTKTATASLAADFGAGVESA